MNEPERIRIRRATAEDVEALSELLQLLFAIEADFRPEPEKQRRGLRQLLNRGEQACILVAESEGQVIGMCTAQVLISTAEGGPVGLVEDVVVHGAGRGQGIGSRLLAALEEWARARGLTRLQLLADRANAPALEFYRRRGWQPTRLCAWRRHPEH